MLGLKEHINWNKYILFTINLASLIAGIVLVIFGLNAIAVFYDYSLFLTSKFYYVCLSTIAIGGIVIVIAFFACWAALLESYCSVLILTILLALTSLLALAAGICGYNLSSHTRGIIEEPLTNAMKEYSPYEFKIENAEWDYLQKTLSCCGVYSYSDWLDIFDQVPISCCFVPAGVLGNFNCTAENENPNLHLFGCLDYFALYIKAEFASLGLAGITIGVIMFCAMLRSCYLYYEPCTKPKQVPRA